MAKLWTFLLRHTETLKIHGQKKTLKKKTLFVGPLFSLLYDSFFNAMVFEREEEEEEEEEEEHTTKSNNNNARNKVFITLYIHGVFYFVCARVLFSLLDCAFDDDQKERERRR